VIQSDLVGDQEVADEAIDNNAWPTAVEQVAVDTSWPNKDGARVP
jgi:hypothetical protein